MADTVIRYDTNLPLGANLADAVGRFLKARADIDRIMLTINEMTAGGTEKVNLETDTTLIAAPTGDGTALYDAVNNAKVNAAVVDMDRIDLGA